MTVKKLKRILENLPDEMEIVVADRIEGMNSLHEDKIEIKLVVMHLKTEWYAGEHRLLSSFTLSDETGLFSQECLFLG